MRELLIPAGGAALPAAVHPAAGESRGAVVICHGFCGSKEGGGRAVRLAEQIAAAGFTALRFDFTPLQKLSRQVEEIRAVVAYCRARFKRRVVLLGRSMGGGAALAYRRGDPKIAGVCLWSTPWDLAETFRLALREGYAELTRGRPIKIPYRDGEVDLKPDFIEEFARYDLLAAAREMEGTPLLILHGADDAIVPAAQARRLYDAARRPKRFALLAGGDHHLTACHEKACAAVVAWLRGEVLHENGRSG